MHDFQQNGCEVFIKTETEAAFFKIFPLKQNQIC